MNFFFKYKKFNYWSSHQQWEAGNYQLSYWLKKYFACIPNYVCFLFLTGLRTAYTVHVCQYMCDMYLYIWLLYLQNLDVTEQLWKCEIRNKLQDTLLDNWFGWSWAKSWCVCVSSADIKPQRWRNSWRSSQTSTCSLSSELLFITSHSVVLVESIIRLFVPVLVI